MLPGCITQKNTMNKNKTPALQSLAIRLFLPQGDETMSMVNLSDPSSQEARQVAATA